MSQKLEQLYAKYELLNDIQKRAVSSVVGAGVADAATRPVHWLYDRTKLEATIGDQNPAFWSSNLSPFYNLPTGRRSCYNDQGFIQLSTLPARSTKEIFNVNAYLGGFQILFGLGSEYAVSSDAKTELYSKLPPHTLASSPIEGPWQQHAVSFLLKELLSGDQIKGDPDAKQTDGFAGALPLISR